MLQDQVIFEKDNMEHPKYFLNWKWTIEFMFLDLQ